MPKKTITPLRYPGGKAKLKNYTKSLIEKNNLIGCTYYEAFAGGAGLAMELLNDNIVSSVVLNDIDRSVFALWYSILNNSTELINLVNSVPIDIENWRKQKEVQSRKETADLLELGFSTLFLNRTNRSGILQAGPIGGKLQTGNYKMDCRFNKSDIVDRIEWIARNNDKVLFYNLDAIDFIENVIIEQGAEKSFTFFDPPYYVKGPGLYLNSYAESDHQTLSQVITALDIPWVVTYDNENFISNLYSEFNQTTYSLNYSAHQAQLGTELIVYSNNLNYANIEFAH